MGIKYFFGWMRKTFVNHIKTVRANDNIKDIVDVDTFLIDMNGIFHYCCQKTYEYGSFRHLRDNEKNYEKKITSSQRQKYLMKMVGNYLDRLIRFVKPRQRVVMAIDGPAPLSKQTQQRSRRYRSARDNEDGMFDSNAITPGTEFLDHLSKYIDWHIRTRVSDGTWGENIEVIFSSEKSPGEGEHKLVKYVRDHGDEKETYMMHGMDADLVMLSLATHKPNFHILRDNPYRYEYEYYYIDLKSIRENLVNALLCEQSLNEDKIYINDFIAMIFLTGNDFLPHLPTIEILEGGIDQLFDSYRKVVKAYGPITSEINTLELKSLQHFIGTLSLRQEECLREKRSKTLNFPDRLLEKHTSLVGYQTYNDEEKDEKTPLFSIDFASYRNEYYTTKMKCKDEKQIEHACHQYIDGLQWVLTYYTRGVTDWRWHYEYDYAPFLSDIANAFNTYQTYLENKKFIPNERREPYPPFLQLLCVLPPKSRNLLPHPLNDVMVSHSLSEFYPEMFDVDMDGKMNDWEGVVILPKLKLQKIEKEYEKNVKLVDDREKRRNIIGKSFVYRQGMNPYVFKSYYGNITECTANSSIFNL